MAYRLLLRRGYATRSTASSSVLKQQPWKPNRRYRCMKNDVGVAWCCRYLHFDRSTRVACPLSSEEESKSHFDETELSECKHWNRIAVSVPWSRWLSQTDLWVDWSVCCDHFENNQSRRWIEFNEARCIKLPWLVCRSFTQCLNWQYTFLAFNVNCGVVKLQKPTDDVCLFVCFVCAWVWPAEEESWGEWRWGKCRWDPKEPSLHRRPQWLWAVHLQGAYYIGADSGTSLYIGPHIMYSIERFP